MKTLRCTASALRIRSLPGGEDTGGRLIHGQAAIAHGVSYDGGWAYVEAPAGVGWASLGYLEEVDTAAAVPSWPSIPRGIAGIRETYGDIREYLRADGSLRPEWEREVITGRVQLPTPLPLAWNPDRTVTRFACHELAAGRLQSAFDEVHRRGYWSLLEDFGGCFNFRRARGLSKLSTHAWGIAVDVAVRSNPLGNRPTLDSRIVAIFEDHGFVWGGRWSRPDGMHFQLANGY